jgi:uncharacterized membrane protein
MTLDKAPPAASSNRKLRLALMASLAVNVLIIGGIAGSMLMGPHHKGPHRGGSILLFFARNLPSDRADLIRQNVADAQPALETLRKAERDARENVRAQLVADPYDQAKLDAAVEQLVQADTKEHTARTAVFAKTVGQLTPEERHQLRDWLDKHRPPR